MTTIKDVEAAVCGRFNLTPDQIKAKGNQRHIARPRQIAMFLAREMTEQSFPTIGTYFCRDHSTAVHAVERIKSMIVTNPRIHAYVEECRAVIPWVSSGDAKRTWFLKHAALLEAGQISWPADRVPDGVG